MLGHRLSCVLPCPALPVCFPPTGLLFLFVLFIIINKKPDYTPVIGSSHSSITRIWQNEPTMKRTQRRKGLHRPPPASTLSSPLYERILQFKALSSFRQQGTDVRMFAQEFSDAAEGLGFNHAALKDLFNSALDEPLNWWRMRGLEHLSFGEFVGFLARSPAMERFQWRPMMPQRLQWQSTERLHPQWKPSRSLLTARSPQSPLQWRPKRMQLPQWWLTKLQYLQWQLSKLQHPQLWPKKPRHPILGNRRGGGGGRRLLPHFKAWRPFQSPLLARRPFPSCPSSSPCRRSLSSSPCRRRPGFLSCWGRPGCLPSSWLRPGLLTDCSRPGLSLRSHPGCFPGFLFGRILPGPFPQLHRGSLPGSLDGLSLPGSTLASLPGLAELPCWHWLGFPPSLPPFFVSVFCLFLSGLLLCVSLCVVMFLCCHVSVLFLVSLLGGGGGGVVSGFCHFGLGLFMVLWQSPDTPVMSCFHVSARSFDCAWAMRSLVYVPCFVLERGVRIPAFISWDSVFVSGFGHSRSIFCHCVSVRSRVCSTVRSPVHVCFVVLHAARVSIGCVHSCYILCCVARSLCISLAACFHVVMSCVNTWLMSFLISCLFVSCFTHGWWIVCWPCAWCFCFVWARGFWPSFLCAMCSHVNLSWLHPSCYLFINSFSPAALPRYPPHLLPSWVVVCLVSSFVLCAALSSPALSSLASLFFPYGVVFVCFIYYYY